MNANMFVRRNTSIRITESAMDYGNVSLVLSQNFGNPSDAENFCSTSTTLRMTFAQFSELAAAFDTFFHEHDAALARRQQNVEIETHVQSPSVFHRAVEPVEHTPSEEIA